MKGISEIAEKNINVISSRKLIYTDEKRGENNGHISTFEDIDNRIKTSKDAVVVIIFEKATLGEENSVVKKTIEDRLDLDLWHEPNELIEKVYDVNKNIVVVINAPDVVNFP